jgi:hypothetical protein
MVSGVDQIYYRLHGSNMSRTTYSSTIINLHETRRAFDAALAGDDPQRAAMLRVAHETLARKALRLATAYYMSGEEDDGGIEGYKRFATATDPRVVDSQEWRGLGRRQAVGSERARRSPLFRTRELVRDLENRLVWRRWRFSGI